MLPSVPAPPGAAMGTTGAAAAGGGSGAGSGAGVGAGSGAFPGTTSPHPAAPSSSSRPSFSPLNGPGPHPAGQSPAVAQGGAQLLAGPLFHWLGELESALVEDPKVESEERNRLARETQKIRVAAVRVLHLHSRTQAAREAQGRAAALQMYAELGSMAPRQRATPL